MFFLLSSRTQEEIRINVEYIIQVSVMPLVLYFSPVRFFYTYSYTLETIERSFALEHIAEFPMQH